MRAFRTQRAVLVHALTLRQIHNFMQECMIHIPRRIPVLKKFTPCIYCSVGVKMVVILQYCVVKVKFAIADPTPSPSPSPATPMENSTGNDIVCLHSEFGAFF